jgi:heptosyltransferase-3
LNQTIFDQLAKVSQSSVLNASGLLSLGQTTTLLSGARAYVGVDTSITHQAAAVGTPVVAIFGPTSPVYFGPWPKGIEWASGQDSVWTLVGSAGNRVQREGNVTIVQGAGDCVPCMRMGCDDHNQSHSACLDGLGYQRVLSALQEVL